MSSALIFGVAGFVGGYLVDELSRNGYDVYGADISPHCSLQGIVDYISADVTSSNDVDGAFRRFAPDVVVNLAAISSVGRSWLNPFDTMAVNLGGAINVLEGARKQSSPPKVLLVGSSEEYAASPRPLSEEDRLDASSPYGISKMAQEQVSEIYEKRYGIRIYRTRSFNHTGPGQSPDFVLPNWCKQVAEIEAGFKPNRLYVGNIDIFRDFTDVRDVVRAYRLLLESDKYGTVYNIGSGHPRHLREIAETIISFSEHEIDIEVDSSLIRTFDTERISCDTRRVRNALGWAPDIPFDVTLREIYESFLSRF